MIALDAAARKLGINRDRLQSMSGVAWPVPDELLSEWEEIQPPWLVEARRREAHKKQQQGQRRPQPRGGRHQESRRWEHPDDHNEKVRWIVSTCPNGHQFAVREIATNRAFDDGLIYIAKDPWSYCGLCNGEMLVSVADLHNRGYIDSDINTLGEADWYAPNPHNPHYAPMRLWNAAKVDSLLAPREPL